MRRQEMGNGDPSLLEGTNGKTLPEQDVAMRESIRRYVFNETDPDKHGVIRRMYEQWEEWNEEFFDGLMTVPIILLNEPSNPRRLGDCGPVSGFGCSSQIRIRPSLLVGTVTEGKWLYGADVLLHEMVHQWGQEITGERDKHYSGHGPFFAAKVNEIGAKLGLPEVGKSCKDRDRKNDEPSPSHWPANVRSDDYYGFPARSSCVSISKDEEEYETRVSLEAKKLARRFSAETIRAIADAAIRMREDV